MLKSLTAEVKIQSMNILKKKRSKQPTLPRESVKAWKCPKQVRYA